MDVDLSMGTPGPGAPLFVLDGENLVRVCAQVNE